jgi:hypothetical protein
MIYPPVKEKWEEGYRKRPVDRDYQDLSICPGPLQMRSGVGEKSWSGEMASGKNQNPEMQQV